MRSVIKPAFAFCLLGISSHASSGTRPTEADLAPVGEACQEEGARTLLAYRGREEHLDKALFLARIPPASVNSPRQVKAAHQIIEDVYRLSDISDDTLYFYRFQVCRVEWITGIEIPSSASMDKALRNCQSKHLQDKDALHDCVFSAVLNNIPG
jgi:hypothetical protein